MADGARQSTPDLEAARLSERFDFFELMRRLEREGGPFGHAGPPDREPARLGQHVRLGFAVQDVAEFLPAADNQPAQVTIANVGLLGPEGPMPLHMTRWVLDRISQRWFGDGTARQTSDTTFIDFANILQHRMIALFYRAWADQQPAVQAERVEGGRVRAMLEAVAGTGLPGSDSEAGLGPVRLKQAAALALQSGGPERLTHFLSQALAVPVKLKEFVACWIAVPKALQTQLGAAHAGLGSGASIGPRSFQRQSRIELVVGPLGLTEFKAFLPGGKRLGTLKSAIGEMVGGNLDVDLRIVLKRDEVPAAKLGSAQLGRVAWLAPRADRGDAEDMLMRTAVGWRAEAA